MNYSVNLSSGQTVEVVIGEAAQINVEQALNYIESGRVEITKYVNEWAKPEIANYTNEYAKPIVTEIVNQTTKPLIDDYLNTTTKPQIDEYVADNVKPYSDSAQDSAAKAKISEDNAKTSETNAKASELAAASSAGVASAAAVTATEAKDYTAKVLTDENLKTVGQDLQSAESNIKTVATNIVNVNTVAKNIDNVNLLAPHTEAMEALAPDIMDVVTVAGITEQTKNVSENMAHVVAVDNNKANIDKAVANATNITTVATSINNVNAVAGNKANIDNVAANKTNINTVSANITAVNNVSENMADVKNAVQSANDAKLWAVGTKTEKPEGSSKYWAEQAKNAVQISDATETVKGIVRLATSDEVTAGTNDSAAITPLKLKQKIAQDLTNPSADTVPSTKAVSDESSRIGAIVGTKVNKSGDTMTGDLTINNGVPFYILQNNTKDLSKTFTDNKNDAFIIERDKNRKDGGFITFRHDIYDANMTEVCASNGVDPNRKITSIGIWVKKNGEYGTFAPRCSFENSLVTTVSHGSNYVRFGNGLQICWGITARENISTVILPQAFKNNAYIVLALPSEGSTNTSDLYVHSKTTTQFKLQEQVQKPEQRQWLALGYWY